ncbi:TraR/DksA family transcriptional regulator [Marinilabilia salmonicolor]|uniref:TraR/DksA family transcriptional regulator n=1 Tax=Marinilabilia salmonicolor TaxID=989 RepID=UPI00029AE262|nr:TraR/DksA C4-type zinc finger protein [Marinilabilia salmonicolor]
MTKDEKEQLVTIIEAEIQKLKAKIEELKQFTEPIEPDCAIGRISRMDAINNKTIFDASMRNSKNRLSQLEQVLKLKNDGIFGICTKCHQSIPFERLKIRPEIRFCANCLKR